MAVIHAKLAQVADLYHSVHSLQVVSNRMQKSILVAVDKWKYIAKYKTRIKRTKKLMVRRARLDLCIFAL